MGEQSVEVLQRGLIMHIPEQELSRKKAVWTSDAQDSWVFLSTPSGLRPGLPQLPMGALPGLRWTLSS